MISWEDRVVEGSCYQHARREANRERRGGAGIFQSIKCASPTTQLPWLGPASQKFHHIPVVPQAVRQAVNTQTFTGCFRSLPQQLPRTGFVKPGTMKPMLARKEQVETVAFPECLFMNQRRVVVLKWKMGTKPRLNYSRKLSTAPRELLFGLVWYL